MPKMAHFGEFLKIWSLWSNSVTRQVNFNWTKIGGKCPNSKTQMRLFGWFSNTVKKSHSDSLKKILCFTRKCDKMKFLELFLNTAFFTEKKAPKIPASYWWKCSTLDRSRDWAKLAKLIRIPDVSERWHGYIGNALPRLWNSEIHSHSQCLKITQNVTFEFFKFGIFTDFFRY